MYKNILLPLDGSEMAEESVSVAEDLAKILGARITLMQTYDLLPVLPKQREDESKALIARAEEYLSAIGRRMQEKGIHSSVVVREGDPSQEICRYADRGDVDLLILSSHGYGALKNWAIGSVSDKVIRHSPKPVLLLRVLPKSPLSQKNILVVDDEPDILEVVEEMLDMCLVQKATDYDSALKFLTNNIYDIVILDIMGVNGIELLKASVARGFPTVMLTAHSLTPESLKESIKHGAVSYVPKEKIPELKDFLENVVLGEGKPLWKKVFDRFSDYFHLRFGWNDQEKERFFEEVEELLKAKT